MKIDEKFENAFKGRIKQVFIYVTNSCNLSCKQCLYKIFLKEKKEISIHNVINLLSIFRSYGAYKLTLIGGEPTLYDSENRNENLFKIISFAKEVGYAYVRMDTNGQFRKELLDNKYIKMLDEISFSIDGHDSETNDIVRGTGSFDRCLSNVSYAVENGYNVHITSCVHSRNYDIDAPISSILKMIELGNKLGIKTLNFHPILKVGISRDSWIEDTNISPEKWMNIYYSYSEILKKAKYLKIRIPQRFVRKELFLINEDKYRYCPVEMRERILLFPNGDMKICAFQIGENKKVAFFDEKRISWEENSYSNEIEMHKQMRNGICSTQKIEDENFIPLCMSFKPGQDEIVWNNINNSKI